MNAQTSNNIVTIVKIVLARLRFVAVFVVAGLVVGYWDSIVNHVDKWTRPAVAPDAHAAHAAGEIEHYCPMHPQVVRAEPGQCPKCGMPLVKRIRGEAVKLPADVLARVQLTPQRVALAGVATSAVEYRELSRSVRAVGLLDYDESRLARLSARVPGRVDELFVTYVGQQLRRGEPLYTIYSPDVYSGLREYLHARRRVNESTAGASAAAGTQPTDARMDAVAVYNASLQRLVLWGLSTEQLDQIDHEYDSSGKIPTNLPITSPIDGAVVAKQVTQGQYLGVGDAPFTVADLSQLWLRVKLYERDIPLVRVGDAVVVRVDALPGEAVEGMVTFVGVALDPETRTLDARVVVPNQDQRLRPGMLAEAVVRVPALPRPANAGLETLATAPDASDRATGPGPAATADPAKLYWAALQPYLDAHRRMAQDSAEGVADNIRLVRERLGALSAAEPAVGVAVKRVNAVADVLAASGPPSLVQLRESWKEISAAMIEVAKAVGLPPDAPAVKVYRCPMKKANWLYTGDEVVNAYYGSEMYACGSAVESIPRAALPQAGPPGTTRAATATRGGAARVLSVPRSAVIDTGERTVVYVEAEPGTYDQRAVTVGAPAGEYYPLLSGLEEGERVVTAGAFLIDAENRLNPTKVQKSGPSSE